MGLLLRLILCIITCTNKSSSTATWHHWCACRCGRHGEGADERLHEQAGSASHIAALGRPLRSWHGACVYVFVGSLSSTVKAGCAVVFAGAQHTLWQMVLLLEGSCCQLGLVWFGAVCDQPTQLGSECASGRGRTVRETKQVCVVCGPIRNAVAP